MCESGVSILPLSKIFLLDFGIVLTVSESLFFMVLAKRYNTLLGKILLNIRFNLATIICFVSFCTLIPFNLNNRNDNVSVDVQVVYTKQVIVQNICQISSRFNPEKHIFFSIVTPNITFSH